MKLRHSYHLLALLAAAMLGTAGCGCLADTAGDPPASESAETTDADDPSEQVEDEKEPEPAESAPAQLPSTAPAEPGSPQAALEEYIVAQENADWAATADCLVEAAQDEFDEATEDMTADDLIETGLRFREEEYKLESSDETSAIFFSRKANLYLVMAKEDGKWKVDPARTDQMNLETD